MGDGGLGEEGLGCSKRGGEGAKDTACFFRVEVEVEEEEEEEEEEEGTLTAEMLLVRLNSNGFNRGSW